MDDAAPLRLDYTPNDYPLRACLDAARWFAHLLASDPSLDRLADAVLTLGERLTAPTLVTRSATLPVRELLRLVARAANLPTEHLDAVVLANAIRGGSQSAFRTRWQRLGAPRLTEYEQAITRELHLLDAHPAAPEPIPPPASADLYAVHYSCSRLDECDDRTPEVFAIGVERLRDSARFRFVGYQEAESMGLSRVDARRFTPQLEAALLRRFFQFADSLPHAAWLHWNMMSVRFGFDVLAQRFRTLNRSEPPDIPARQFDLAEFLKRTFGDHYVDHPRLHQLAALNGLCKATWLDPDAEARAWAAGRSVVVAEALAARVAAIATLYRRLVGNRLTIGGGRLVGLGSSGPQLPADGATNDRGQVALRGAWYSFGCQQRKLLKLALRPDGVGAEEAIRELGLSGNKHFNKLLTDLRGSLSQRLRRAPEFLDLVHVDGHLTTRWVPRSAA